MRKILTAKISNQLGFLVLGGVGVIFSLFTMIFWIIGLKEAPPRFILDPMDSGRIMPVDQSWWRTAADGVHGRKYLMLTFDDGPANREINETILKVLEKHHAHAAFFTVCKNALSEEGAQNLKTLLAAGHVLANHSYSHAKLIDLGLDAVAQEVVQCQKTLADITGKEVKWFRPPWGQNSPALLETLETHKLQDVLWSANSGDSWLHNPADVTEITLAEVDDNSIVLMHSNRVEALALDESLTRLEAKGYRFVLAEE